jgi:GT2 family glycosyltransferase
MATMAPERPNSIPAVVPQPARLGVVLVNWNRGEDTIECLASLFRQTTQVRVVVVDNGSTDGSAELIMAWAAGEKSASATSDDLAHLSRDVITPIPTQRLVPAQVPAYIPGKSQGAQRYPLTLIASPDNLGFAGGNNLGLRLLLADSALDYFWLLNNDTVAEPGAAAALISRMDATHKVGMCGTIVRYYHDPETVQALNGNRMSIWTGQAKGIGKGSKITEPFNPATVTAQTDFVLGASLAVSRKFLETIGPMDEKYFLYFEEADWAARNRNRFRIAFAHGATVYHKEGGSIGSSGKAGQRSAKSDYWLTRSRLRFVRRHRPLLAPWHYFITLPIAARRLLRGQPGKAAAVLRAMAGL